MKTVIRIKRQHWTRERGKIILFLSLLRFPPLCNKRFSIIPTLLFSAQRTLKPIQYWASWKETQYLRPLLSRAFVGRIATASRAFFSHFSFTSCSIDCLPKALKKQNLTKQMRKIFNNQGKAITVKFSPQDSHLRCARQEKSLNTSVWT